MVDTTLCLHLLELPENSMPAALHRHPSRVICVTRVHLPLGIKVLIGETDVSTNTLLCSLALEPQLEDGLAQGSPLLRVECSRFSGVVVSSALYHLAEKVRASSVGSLLIRARKEKRLVLTGRGIAGALACLVTLLLQEEVHPGRAGAPRLYPLSCITYLAPFFARLRPRCPGSFDGLTHVLAEGDVAPTATTFAWAGYAACHDRLATGAHIFDPELMGGEMVRGAVPQRRAGVFHLYAMMMKEPLKDRVLDVAAVLPGAVGRVVMWSRNRDEYGVIQVGTL